MKLLDPTAKTNWKFIVIVAFLAVFITGGIVMLIPQLEEQAMPLFPSEIPSRNGNYNNGQVFDISTWQTYRNDEFGFEVRYPIGWKIVEEDTVSVTKRLGDWFSKIDDTIILRGSEQQNIIIDILPIEEGRTMEEMMTVITPILGEKEFEGELSTPGPGVLPTRSNPQKIGETLFYSTGMSSYQSAGPYIIYYYLPDSKNNRVVAFQLTLAAGYGVGPYYEYALGEEPNHKRLKQILYTFRFVE